MARTEGKAHFTATSQGVNILLASFIYLEGINIFYYHRNFGKKKKRIVVWNSNKHEAKSIKIGFWK